PTHVHVDPELCRSQRIRTRKYVRTRASLLTLPRPVATIEPWPSPPMRRGSVHPGGDRMDDFDGLRTVTRRQVLKGGAAVAALGGVSAFLAACSTPAAATAPTAAASAAAPSAAAPSVATSAEAPSTAVSGSVTLGSNYSD